MSSVCLTPYYNQQTKMFCRCGKCENCMRVKRDSWSYRMDRELKFGGSVYQTFVTLTYTDKDLTILDNPSARRLYHYKNKLQYACIKPSDWSDFLSHLQKFTKNACSKLQRYYTLMEYGAIEKRPHIHVILFSPLSEELTKKYVRESWDKISKGALIDFQPITFADITYCAKHNLKECGGNSYQNFICPPRTSCSKKNGGIGIEFFLQNPQNTDTYAIINNFRINYPEFYRKKQKAFANIMEFAPHIRKMVLSDRSLLARLLSFPELQKYESRQRAVIKRTMDMKHQSLFNEYAKAHGIKVVDIYKIKVNPYYTYVLPEMRIQNKEKRIARLNRVRTKTILKIKQIHYIKNL